MIITANSLNLPLPNRCARLVYCDPPWNLSMNEGGSSDSLTESDYAKFVVSYLKEAIRIMDVNSWLILTIYNKIRLIHELSMYKLMFQDEPFMIEFVQELIWYYNFGRYTRKMFVPCHDNILIYRKGNPKFYWEQIAIQSQRQKTHDLRADSRGRTPGSVIRIPRLPANAHEKRFLKGIRRTSQPQDLVKLLIKAYTLGYKKEELVVDMFSGTGTVSKVCKILHRECLAFEICEQYNKEAIDRIENDWKLALMAKW